jgi:oligopeptidase B
VYESIRNPCYVLLFLLTLLLLNAGADPMLVEAELNPPVAKTVPHPMEAHGKVRQDPYYWMRDDTRQDPEMLEYLHAENDYAEAVLAPHSDFRESLFQEIVARIPQEDRSVPYKRDGYFYYSRQEKGKEFSIYCRQTSLDNPEQIILDVNVEAEGKEYYSSTSPNVTIDGKTMAFGEDTVSRRIYTIRFRDLETGTDLKDRIDGTAGRGVWALDNQTFFYTKRDPETLRAYQVWRHKLGQDVEEDALVFQEDDEEFEVYLSRSRSREFIFIDSDQTLVTEYLSIDASQPESKPAIIVPRQPEHECLIDHYDGQFFVRTNWKAKNFRLMSVPTDKISDRGAWQELIPGREDVLLGSFEVFQDFMAVSETENGLKTVRVLPRGGHKVRDIVFEDDGYTAYLGYNPDPKSRELRLEYTSLTTPWSVYDFEVDTGRLTLKKEAAVGGGFDRDNYQSRRLDATAVDGTPVTISLVWRRDLDRSKPQPLLLYAYGSYGSSLNPYFRSSRLSLLDRGVIFAMAHVRGGQEKGRQWYDDGKLLKKKNTFTDFIACAEHLIDTGWTSEDHLLAQGGSAGGLLMGAVVNMRGELFKGVVADVPFVDVVTTMLDPSIPLTTFEYDEWGNPENEEYYDYMLSYSPYDNVVAQDYPALLVLTGLHDSQVQYWEPAKWVAKLRTTKTNDQPLLFSVNMDAGHGGASGRFKKHKETALIYTFLLDMVGKTR